MRLIDADKLQDDGVNYSYDKSENFGIISKEYRFVNRVQIDTAPTVEAIPIEWLEKWKKCKTSIEQVVADKIMMDYKYRDWEKENDS